jgi:hypothetical protein
MRHAILIVSKDKSLLESRALLLKSAGYLTLKASTITGSAGLASFCHLAIIDKTFTTEDHVLGVATIVTPTIALD